VLSDDLAGGIAEDPLGAGVPAEHDSGPIDGHERLVEHTVHERAQALLTPPNPLFRLLSGGHVAEGDQEAFVVPADAHVAHLVGQDSFAEDAILQPVDCAR
jgi:hypothetical protein